MTDITDLAKDMLIRHKRLMAKWASCGGGKTAEQEIIIIEKAAQLAQMVVDSKQNPNWCLGCNPDNCTGCERTLG